MEITSCQRCKAKCKIDPKPQSKAKMLKRGKTAKGYCVNCALHDWLRNTYPANLILAGMRNPAETLRLDHIQQQITGIMKAGLADACPDEINWLEIIWNWDLPFKDKVKGAAMNPASQMILDMEPEMRAHEENYFREEKIAKDEGFDSLFAKQKAKQDKYINEVFLPALRKQNKKDEDIQ